MVPASPIPIPGVSKSLLPGGKKLKNKCLMIFYGLIKKHHRCTIEKQKTILYWVLDGTNIGPYSPHPHPWRQQLPGGNKIKNLFLMFSIQFKENQTENSLMNH